MGLTTCIVVPVFAVICMCFLSERAIAKEVLHGNGNSSSLARRYFKSGFMRTNQHSVEMMLLYREAELFPEVVAQAREQGYTIQGFYHTSTWQPRWADVILEQLKLLDGQRRVPKTPTEPTSQYVWQEGAWASLLGASEGLYLNVAGPTRADEAKIKALVAAAPLAHKSKVRINFNQTVTRDDFGGADEARKKLLLANKQLTAGEHSTIDTLHDYCERKVRAGEKAIVYYMHSKSGCCFKEFGSKEKSPRASWREEMNAFNVEFPSICLRALLKGYNSCGVENQDAHYSGNFWWADCAHVASLSKPHNRFDAWSAEFYIQRYSVDHALATRIGYHCGYSAFHCGINLYDLDCERDMYRDRLFKLVMSHKLAPSSRGKPHVNDTQRCIDIRGPNYNDNQVYVRDKFKGIN